MQVMKLIDGKKYYTIEEVATLAGVSMRTLRRWVSAGQLSDFVYPFRAGSNEVLYRLEPPEENDVKNKKGEWVIRSGTDGSLKGGAPNEGGSSS